VTEAGRADRLEAMIDRMSEKLAGCTLLIVPIRELIMQIEKCGASEELTKAVVMANDISDQLMTALDVKQYPAGTE
jgi:hypothetical protein